MGALLCGPWRLMKDGHLFYDPFWMCQIAKVNLVIDNSDPNHGLASLCAAIFYFTMFRLLAQGIAKKDHSVVLLQRNIDPKSMVRDTDA